MGFHKWLAFGILIATAMSPLVAHSWTDQYSSSTPLRLNVTVTSIKQWLWKAGELATTGYKDDSAVAQFTWTVKDIEDKITKAKQTQVQIYSPSFYTDVPGYRVRLSLQLYDTNTSNMGVYMGLVKGQFDDLVSWPFDNEYELSSAGPNGTTFANKLTDPSTDSTQSVCYGVFYRPPYSTDSCGNEDYFDVDTLLSNKTSYLIDGALNINFTIYLVN